MKMIYRTLITILASNLFISSAFAFCILGLGTSCKGVVNNNTATNKVTATVNSGSDSKSASDSQSAASAEVTVPDAFKIMEVLGIQDSTTLFIPLTAAATKQTESTEKIFKELRDVIKDINKSNQELLVKQADEQRKFTEQLVKQVIASPPTIPIVSGSSSFPIILPTNSQTTPIYINEVNQQLTNTLNNLNTTLSNMSIPIAGGTVTNIPNGPGSTLAPVAIADLPTGGVIGTAATTVDINSAFVITQTTASQTITLPSPTLPTGSRLVTVQSGSGSTNSFTIYGETLSASQAVDLLWNGSAWVNASGGDPTTETLNRYRVTRLLNPTGQQSVTSTTPAAFNLSTGTVNINTGTITPVLASGQFTFPSTSGDYRIALHAYSDDAGGTASALIIRMLINGVETVQSNNTATDTYNFENAINTVRTIPASAVVTFTVASSDGETLRIQGYDLSIVQLPTAVAPVVNTVAEYGEQVLGSSVLISNTSTNSGNATDIMSFTIPSAGTWDIDYTIRGVKNETNADNVVRMVTIITNNSNSVITNSELMVGGQRGGSTSGLANDLQASGAMRLRVTTTGATTYKVRGFNDGSSGAFTWTAVSDGNGKTKVSWTKIAGQLPSTGTTVDYVNARLTADTLVASNTAIPYVTQTGNIPNASGVFSLTAGKTYRLTAMVAYTGTQSTEAFISRWRDITNNVTLGADGSVFSTDFPTAVSASPVIEAVITPTTNIQVRVEHTDSGSRTFSGTASGNGQNWATIVQLGSTSNTVGTLPAVDQSSAGYFDIGNMRMQWGQGVATTAAPLTVNLAVPFANANYSLTGSVIAGGDHRWTRLVSQVSSSFSMGIVTATPSFATGTFNWFAIGQKP